MVFNGKKRRKTGFVDDYRLLPAVLAVCLALLFLATACSSVEEFDDNYTERGIGERNRSENRSVRPEVPRSNYTLDPVEDDGSGASDYDYEKNRSVFLDTPNNEFYLSTNSDLLELYEPIGEVVPYLDKRVAELLTSRPVFFEVRGGVPMRQELRFEIRNSSGGKTHSLKPVFGVDEEDETGTFLFLEEGEPVLKYLLELSAGRWEEFVEGDISVLGEQYMIYEATNNSLVLFGKSINQTITFADGDKLRVNGSVLADTRVEVDERRVEYTLLAPDVEMDGLLIGEGESLKEKVGSRRLLRSDFDILYQNLTEENSTKVEFDRGDSGYYLEFTNIDGDEFRTPLVYFGNNSLRFGDEDSEFHVKRCSGAPCISEEDTFLVTGRGGASHVLEYSGISLSGKNVVFRFKDTRQKMVVEFEGRPGGGARGGFEISGERFTVYVGNSSGEYPVSVSGLSGGRSVPLVVPGFGEFTFDKRSGDVYVEMTSPGRYLNSRSFTPYSQGVGSGGYSSGSEKTVFVIDNETERVGVETPEYTEVFERDDSDDSEFLTRYGARVVLEDYDSSEGAEDVAVEYPLLQRVPRVLVRE